MGNGLRDGNRVSAKVLRHAKKLARSLILCAFIMPLGQELPGAVALATPQLPDPGNTGVSKEQQEQIGLQAVAEVYKQMPVLPDSSPETRYIQQLGNKLKSVIPAQESWPYEFHLISQKEINAFAVPGGPIFVNLGTITAADNEAQLAGVISHEMAHIYMQHSIKQMKKQQVQQGIAGLIGAVLGQGNGIASTLGRLGLGIGNGLLSLRYSRSDEAQADEVGAVILYKAGYDPVEMAQFFQKLQQQGGSNGPNFLSDHPDPGNRVASIQQEISRWPPVRTKSNTGLFTQVRQRAQGLRAYTAQEIAQGAQTNKWAEQNRQNGVVAPNAGAAGGVAQPVAAGSGDLANVSFSQVKPSGTFRPLQTGLVNLSYPSNWQVMPDANQQGITIAPSAGAAQGAVAYGVVIHSAPNQGGSLDQQTQALAAGLVQANQGLGATSGMERIQINGKEGRSIQLSGDSPVRQNGRSLREHDWLVAVPQGQGGLLYFIFIAPEPTFAQLRPTFQRMLDTAQIR